MTVLDDPNADARSLMHRAPCVCDGEASGIACKHYWAVIQKFRSANSDTLRSGDKRRSCTHTKGWMLEFTSEEKPTFCNDYAPRKADGLVAIGKRALGRVLGQAPKAGPTGGAPSGALARMGYVTFNEGFEKFQPMTPEEIEALRVANPDKPLTGFERYSGRMPSSMEDIANAKPIGMATPEQAEAIRAGKDPNAVGDEVSSVLDGLFGDKIKPPKKDGET